MGRYEVSGPGCFDFTNHLITNNVAKLEPGRLLYTPICNERGGVLDDVTAYRHEDRVLLVVNASNRARIWEWMTKQAGQWSGSSVELEDRSEELAQVAIQGPRAQEIVLEGIGTDIDAVGYYHFTQADLFGVPALVSRNGYTGEDGFELYFPANAAVGLWRDLMAAGQARGLVPTGLGARDTLRLEMAYCLYGNELSPEISPIEAGLGWTVKQKRKDPFIAQEILARQKAEGTARRLVGLQTEGRRLPRTGQDVYAAEDKVGVLTSGCFSPSLGHGIGLAIIASDYAVSGATFEIDVRGTRVAATVVETPFYKEGTHR
jgi:aminomethyltransferase